MELAATVIPFAGTVDTFEIATIEFVSEEMMYKVSEFGS